MRKIYFILLLSILSLQLFAQQKVARYYVGGKLYCTHTYYINSERVETSFLNVTNTQNYKGSKYTSCATCRYENNYGVTIMSFQNQNFDNVFNLYIRYVDKQNCILVFKTSDNDDDKMEIYAAKEVITDK
jgi:hypothetical protein